MKKTVLISLFTAMATLSATSASAMHWRRNLATEKLCEDRTQWDNQAVIYLCERYYHGPSWGWGWSW